MGALTQHEPLARHTSYGIGGPAEWYVAVDTVADLRRWLAWGRARDLPITLLGHGSNVLVADAGIRGLIIENRVNGIQTSTSGQLRAASGTPLSDLAYWSVSRGLAGLEWAVGIPGTLGGAVVGNAGAFGGYLGDVVQWVTVLEPDGVMRDRPAAECGFGYRTSAFKRGDVAGLILEVELALQPGDPGELWTRVEDYNARRDATQPREPSAGSVFKRTASHPAGWLIEQAGLKGECYGDACISPRHANFIINRGHATAADVRSLIELAQRRVREQFGEDLELEIELLGDW
ncbi:MAG: UDP-N-acetylmuramate dehydrogenase [Chloroflexi bacterium]|nr:UDP-N-acetylmuramate dehydrogenase [Chloroflexota bacterium]